ncbi:MAG: hypothetical protein KC731_06965 [Myxococcales bacterium]|nr:hypothetical protein [Myxococcales bacterium]
MRRRAFGVGALGALVALGAPDRAFARCDELLTAEMLDASIAAALGYLTRSQRPEGNFVYGYDWHRREVEPDDNAVRQAGAGWALGLAVSEGSATARPALERLLVFHERNAGRRDGRRFPRYPGAGSGKTGTLALAALTYLEAWRSKVLRDRAALDELVAQLLVMRRPEGGFFGSYDPDDGAPEGAPSPYSDGEALLALVKAARYADRLDLLGLVVDEATSGFARHVEGPRREAHDPDVTKAYYQWGSLAHWELATWSRTRHGDEHARRLLDQAQWIIEEHRILHRSRNTGYAYEGIVPAFDVARRRRDPRAALFACTIERGLRKLIAWQVGGPAPNRHIRERGDGDARARGGVQNHAREPLLRIDVTQHQLHAMMLAKRLYLPHR